MSFSGQGIGDTSMPAATPATGGMMRLEIDTHSINLLELHEQVLRRNGRVELATRDGGCCVLITKSELDALEAALAILSDHGEVQAMRQELARVASATMSAV